MSTKQRKQFFRPDFVESFFVHYPGPTMADASGGQPRRQRANEVMLDYKEGTFMHLKHRGGMSASAEGTAFYKERALPHLRRFWEHIRAGGGVLPLEDVFLYEAGAPAQ